jgi:hypothetical protein
MTVQQNKKNDIDWLDELKDSSMLAGWPVLAFFYFIFLPCTLVLFLLLLLLLFCPSSFDLILLHDERTDNAPVSNSYFIFLGPSSTRFLILLFSGLGPRSHSSSFSPQSFPLLSPSFSFVAALPASQSVSH